jgi:hypothetical protein
MHIIFFNSLLLLLLCDVERVLKFACVLIVYIELVSLKNKIW